MESHIEEPAARPLDAITEARVAAADRLITPWWYHPVLGLLIGGYLIVVTIGGLLTRILAMLAFFAALWLLMTAYRRMTGVWISGFAPGAPKRWAYALGGLAVATMVISYACYQITGRLWPTLALAAVAAVGTIVFGRRFDADLRERLRAGS
jgi:hypothetical protein